MKIACLQMNMLLGEPEKNYEKAIEMIREAASNGADVAVLPETWHTGYFPKDKLSEQADDDGKKIKAVIGSLAKELHINVVAGSVANKKNGKIFNTCFVFDREGNVIAEYDKTHLFTMAHEEDHFTPGDHLSSFTVDGLRCGVIICYDIRFPELVRTYALKGLDVLFVVAQWGKQRVQHLLALSRVRAIENQIFVVTVDSCVPSCGARSSVFDPWGETLSDAGEEETIAYAKIDPEVLETVRKKLPVYQDRRPELYEIH